MMTSSSACSRVPTLRRQAGFSLIEALVALLVVAFGMLGIASFQYTLARASDVAKQRSEATRIAQKDMDLLRSFVQRPAEAVVDPERLTYVEDVVSTGPIQVNGLTTNTSYTLTRTVRLSPSDRFRWVHVVVSWADRWGELQQVRLSSAISDGAPSSMGVLAVAAPNPSFLLPRPRKVNLPFPVVNLAGGTSSAFVTPTGNVAFVFDSATAQVTQRCTGVTALTEGMNLPASCLPLNAYLLSGYVRFKTSGTLPTTAAAIDIPRNMTDATLPLQATDLLAVPAQQPLTIDSGTTGNAPIATTTECYAQERATLQDSAGFEFTAAIDADTGTVYAATDPVPARAALAPPSGFTLTTISPRFVGYACVVTPIDHDGSASTPRIWSGLVTLNPRDSGARSWTIGTASGTFQVCRLSSDYNRNRVVANREHPLYYRHVNAALDNQNFLVVNYNDTCPTDVASDPENGNFLDTNTAAHQPLAALSFYCTGVDATCPLGSRIAFETTPASPAPPIAME